MIIKKIILFFIVLILFNSLSPRIEAQQCSDPNQLIEIRNANFFSWEFVIFYYQNPVASDFTYQVAPIFPPFIENPSYNSIGITGGQHMSIKFENVSWMCSSDENININPARKIMDIRN